MTSIFLILMERMGRAIYTLPNFADIQNSIIVMIIYVLFTLTLGWQSGFLQWELCPSRKIAIRIILTSLFAPAILEELFFRVLLLPAPSDKIPFNFYLAWSGFSLLLFVIYHPLNALTFFPQGRKVFLNPVFLILATALGVVCTITYWQTASLSIPVAIHWLAVVLWLLCFGGLSKLNYKLAETK